MYTVSQKHTRYYSFITLPNVGRFPKIFHRWIQQDISNKHFVTFPTNVTYVGVTSFYATMRKSKCHFYHFSSHTAVISKFTFLLNVIHIIWHLLPCFWLNSNYCLSCTRSIVSYWSSSKTMCHLTTSMSVFPIPPFWNKNHLRFVKHVALTPWTETNELQNSRRNAAGALAQKCL